MKTGSLLKTLLTVIFYRTNTSSFHFNFECSWPIQEVVLPVLLRLGVSKSPKIQSLDFRRLKLEVFSLTPSFLVTSSQ
jgi:hypothetical protein